MKGLIVKSKDKTCKAGIPQCGVGIVANITWHSGLTWTLSGLKMPEEIHLVWNGGMLEIGDVVEVEIAEFDEASTVTLFSQITTSGRTGTVNKQ